MVVDQSSTTDMARALLEDLEHFDEVLSRNKPNRGEVRRLSASLYRFLIEGDLKKVASNRIGRVMIRCPQNKLLMKQAEKNRFIFWGSGGAQIFGVYQRGFSVGNPNMHRAPGNMPENFHPTETVDLQVDSFIKQYIILLQGIWIERRDLIKFMRNKGSVAHSGQPETSKDFCLKQIQRMVKYGVSESGIPQFSFNPEALISEIGGFGYDGHSIDPVLFELLSSAKFIAESPDVLKLKEVIKAEQIAA
jgi:hypothetical protein